jgi:LemA protein
LEELLVLKRLAALVSLILGSLALASCGINSVPAAEENALAKWADVEAAFQERANLLGNLQEITMASAEQDDLNDPEAMARYAEAQNTFGGALSRLMVVQEQYPELRSQDNFGRMMVQVEGIENRIRVAIRDYNEAVRQYNTTIRTFPDTIGANIIHGAEPMVPYEAVTEGAEVAEDLDMRSE